MGALSFQSCFVNCGRSAHVEVASAVAAWSAAVNLLREAFGTFGTFGTFVPLLKLLNVLDHRVHVNYMLLLRVPAEALWGDVRRGGQRVQARTRSCGEVQN